MVGCPNSGCLGRWRVLLLPLVVAPYLCAATPGPVPLRELNRRTPPDFTAVHLNERVLVRGVVNAPAYHFPEYTILGIEDGEGGIAFKVLPSDNRLDSYRPGDELQAEGIVTMYAGAVTITPERLA